MLKKIAIGVALSLAAFAAVVATRPAEFRVERSIEIDAPAAGVFGFVDDFHGWEHWSPWEKLDPAMKKTYDGAESGEGASYHWVGNDEVGEGRMTITASRRPEAIDIQLEFIAPWAATHSTEFRFVENAGSTSVTWAISGKHDFLGKAFSLFMDMDAMVGADFEKGLASLKGLAEAAPQSSPTSR